MSTEWPTTIEGGIPILGGFCATALGYGHPDIHSPRIPSKEEMESLLKKAAKVLSPAKLWVNPDCGLKTSLGRSGDPLLPQWWRQPGR
jgi:Cobalamin-independent synthase, Catalytic domain